MTFSTQAIILKFPSKQANIVSYFGKLNAPALCTYNEVYI